MRGEDKVCECVFSVSHKRWRLFLLFESKKKQSQKKTRDLFREEGKNTENELGKRRFSRFKGFELRFGRLFWC